MKSLSSPAAGTALALLVAGGLMACASTMSESEPPSSRSPRVVGLAPLPMDPVPTAPPAAVSVSNAPSKRTAARGDTPAAEPPPAACEARAGAQQLRRAALDRTLDAGLGTWLRGVDVEPQVNDGRFQGWRVRSIYPGDPCWVDVDLRPGDVVSRINRRPIERPEEAQALWTALRSTREIVIEFSRDGRPHTLKFVVVDGPDGSTGARPR